MNPDPIKHVIVLMFENHSFDQMLGCFKRADGVDPTNLRSNRDSAGREYFQKKSKNPIVSPDPKHELDHVLDQLKDGNSGFVSEYEKGDSDSPTTSEQRQRIMDYFGMGDLPALHRLAKHYLICDHWYSSVPGPTWTNRFFVHSGTSKGLVTMPESITDTDYYLYYDQETIFDLLESAQPRRSWKVYFGDVPQSLALSHQRRLRYALRYRFMYSFWSDVQGPEQDFPEYSFIEPSYFKGEQNDDHPPHSTVSAQRLLTNVYNAIRKNEDLWNSTLLVILYDEHGGFYDHVSPPKAEPPDWFQSGDEYHFDRYGVRVPALLISPWVKAGVLKDEFDHTSLLKYLIDKWNLGSLTTRVAQAKTFAGAIGNVRRPNSELPESVPVPEPKTIDADKELTEPINDLQRSLMVFAEHLEQNELPLGDRIMRTDGPLSEEQQAKKRVEAFLAKQVRSLKAEGEK